MRVRGRWAHQAAVLCVEVDSRALMMNACLFVKNEIKEKGKKPANSKLMMEHGAFFPYHFSHSHFLSHRDRIIKIKLKRKRWRLC